MLCPMIRFAPIAFLAVLSACATTQPHTAERTGFAGTVQKVFRIARQGPELPGIRLLGQVGSVVGPALRQSSETHQYVVRTGTGQIIAQSDDEFSVGDCVEVLPRSDVASGPAFRYGEAELVRSESCTEKQSLSRNAISTL
jgi:hypothetical protein